MTTIIYRRGNGGRFARASALCLLALGATLLRSPEARAQWATSGNTTSTTNSVGIGTSAPTSALEVQGTDATLTLSQAGVPSKVSVQATAGADLHLNVNAQWGSSRWSRNDTTLPSWTFFLSPTPGADFAGLRRAAPSSAGLVWTDIIRFTNAGHVGIGTATPSQIFHVHSTGTWAGSRVTTAATGATFSDGVNFGYDDAYGAYVWNREASPVIFSTSNTERMRVDAAGNVGVGTTAPAAKLHVAGDIRVDGSINAKYQDVAEWVPSTQKLAAGTVVVLDTERRNHVLASTTSYDTRVAGVISAQPGLSLGEAGEGRVLVATTGRVKVKVDASRTPIKIGDLIVTSDVAGVAMRSEPLQLGGRQLHAPGTIVGKALEPLAGGTGEILVLLSLQ